MANFDLSPVLRQFLDLTARSSREFIGKELYVSIRRRYQWSQSLVLYPEDGYNFMTMHEVQFILNAANVLYLSFSFRVENGLPVIEVTEYFKV